MEKETSTQKISTINGMKVFSIKNIIIVALVILLILSFLGVNLLEILGRLLEVVVNMIRPIFDNILSFLFYYIGLVINLGADVVGDVSRTGIDIAEGTAHSIGNLMQNEDNIDGSLPQDNEMYNKFFKVSPLEERQQEYSKEDNYQPILKDIGTALESVRDYADIILEDAALPIDINLNTSDYTEKAVISTPAFTPSFSPGLSPGLSPSLSPGLSPGLSPDVVSVTPTESNTVMENINKQGNDDLEEIIEKEKVQKAEEVKPQTSYCLVGKFNGKRSCMPVDQEIVCQSGQKFSNLDDCLQLNNADAESVVSKAQLKNQSIHNIPAINKFAVNMPPPPPPASNPNSRKYYIPQQYSKFKVQPGSSILQNPYYGSNKYNLIPGKKQVHQSPGKYLPV